MQASYDSTYGNITFLTELKRTLNSKYLHSYHDIYKHELSSNKLGHNLYINEIDWERMQEQVKIYFWIMT